MVLKQTEIMTWQKQLLEFEKYLMNSGKSKRTVSAILSDLNVLEKVMASNNIQSVADLSSQHIDTYLLGVAPTTRSRRVYSLKQIVAWGENIRRITKSSRFHKILGEVDRRVNGTTSITILNRKQIEALLKAAEDELNDSSPDWYLLISLLLVGLKVNDIKDLTWGDIVVYPRKKEAYVNVTPERQLRILTNFKTFYSAYQMRKRREDQRIFPGTTARFRFEGLIEAAGVADISAQTFRWTYAKQLLDTGVSNNQIAQLMGVSKRHVYRIRKIKRNNE